MADLELTVKEAARQLDVSDRTVRRLVNSGRIIGRKLDRGGPAGTWLIDSASVRRVAADLAKPDRPEELHGQQARTDGQLVVRELAQEVRGLRAEQTEQIHRLREENAEYRGHLERLTQEIQSLQQTMQRLLPPAQEEKRSLPWWKFWQRGPQGGKQVDT